MYLIIKRVFWNFILSEIKNFDVVCDLCNKCLKHLY